MNEISGNSTCLSSSNCHLDEKSGIVLWCSWYNWTIKQPAGFGALPPSLPSFFPSLPLPFLPFLPCLPFLPFLSFFPFFSWCPYFNSYFLSFYRMSFCSSLPQAAILHWGVLSLGSPFGWHSFSDFPFVTTLMVLRNTGCCLIECPSIRVYLIFSHGFAWVMRFFGGKTTEVKRYSHHMITRIHTVDRTSHWWCKPWSSGWDRNSVVSNTVHHYRIQ